MLTILAHNIFTMLSSSRGSKKLTIGNVIKFSNYKSSVLHTKLRVSTLVLFIAIVMMSKRNKKSSLKVKNLGSRRRIGLRSGVMGVGFRGSMMLAAAAP